MFPSFTILKIKNHFFGFTFLFAILHSEALMAQYDLVVAQDGTGNYNSVQAAVNAAPTGRSTPYVIYIKKGTYNEKINIPSNKPFIKLVGVPYRFTLDRTIADVKRSIAELIFLGVPIENAEKIVADVIDSIYNDF